LGCGLNERKGMRLRWAARWAEREGELRGFEEVFLNFLNFCFFKKTTQHQAKPMQRHECIKHLVNSKIKCYLI
jgi:hypothetical protein